jgi:hypothetical protein
MSQINIIDKKNISVKLSKFCKLKEEKITGKCIGDNTSHGK